MVRNDGHQGNFLTTYTAEKDSTLFLGHHVSTSTKGSDPPNLFTCESESNFFVYLILQNVSVLKTVVLTSSIKSMSGVHF